MQHLPPGWSAELCCLQVILSLAAALVAGSSVLLGKALKAENSAKLYALTFLLVTFGASELDSGKGAFVLAMTRITGAPVHLQVLAWGIPGLGHSRV